MSYTSPFRRYRAETKPKRGFGPPQAPPFDLHPPKSIGIFLFMVTNRNPNNNVLHLPVQALSRGNQTKTGVRTPPQAPPFDLHPPKSIRIFLFMVTNRNPNNNVLHLSVQALSRGNQTKMGVRTPPSPPF